MGSKRFKAGLEKHRYTAAHGDTPPPRDMELSNSHLLDSAAFNFRHRDEHDEQGQEAIDTLKSRGVDYMKYLKKLGVEL